MVALRNWCFKSIIVFRFCNSSYIATSHLLTYLSASSFSFIYTFTSSIMVILRTYILIPKHLTRKSMLFLVAFLTKCSLSFIGFLWWHTTPKTLSILQPFLFPLNLMNHERWCFLGNANFSDFSMLIQSHFKVSHHIPYIGNIMV